jgi:NAD(P)-dependent dehydrogenase (short-subunit alcohol dehydrogenase family)
MKTIVITGSTRGIGYGLADSFLSLGCSVTISGRAQAGVERAVAKLSSKHQAERIFGHPCDVTQFEQVQALWDAAKAHFGRVDIWINNAGIAHPQLDFWEHSPEQIKAVVETNVVGAMNGAEVSLRGMLEQGSGCLYNMEGLGSDGRRVAGLTLYGSTKYSLRYLTDALVEETRGTPVLVGALKPGMVVTDLLTEQYKKRPEDWERAKRIFNILADRVETVTPWLAQKVLANNKRGVRITWLTRPKIIGRFLIAPFRRRDLFGEDNLQTG